VRCPNFGVFFEWDFREKVLGVVQRQGPYNTQALEAKRTPKY
jgi:hypothetical protein